MVSGGTISQKPKNILRWIVSRAMVFFLVLYGFSLLFVDYDKITYGLKIRTLNMLVPSSFDPLLDMPDRAGQVSAEDIRPFHHFLTSMTTYLPERADGFHAWGYLQFYGGEPERAIEAMEQSVELEPNYFWSRHDLGIMYFLNKDYEKAASMLSSALDVPPRLTYQIIQNPRRLYYLAITRSSRGPDLNLERNLVRGYIRANRLMAAALAQMGRQQEGQAAMMKVQELLRRFPQSFSEKDLIRLQLF